MGRLKKSTLPLLTPSKILTGLWLYCVYFTKSLCLYERTLARAALYLTTAYEHGMMMNTQKLMRTLTKYQLFLLESYFFHAKGVYKAYCVHCNVISKDIWIEFSHFAH